MNWTKTMVASCVGLVFATPSFAEGEVKGSLVVEPSMENALILVGKDGEVMNLEIRGKVGGDVVFKPRMKNALVLTGGNLKLMNAAVR